jgi:hypothetical protein
VPLLIVHGPTVSPGQVRVVVPMTRIAPAVVSMLGIDTYLLEAVRAEGVQVLPSVTLKNDDTGSNGGN